jgi:hypothetical protein
MKAKTVLEAIGAALFLWPLYLPFLNPSNLTFYHHGLPVANIIGGIAVDLLCVALLVFAFLVILEHLPKPAHRAVGALFAAFMVWRFVDVVLGFWIATSRLEYLRYQLLWYSVRRWSCLVILLLAVTLAFILPRVTQPAVRAVRFLLAAAAFSALWIVPQLLHLVLVRQPHVVSASSRPVAATAASSNRRIVWILFDELSYNQAFEHPASGLNLPNFDRLRAESFSFSNLKPAGFYTDLVIPSLFVGRRIDEIRSTVEGDLSYKDESQHRWVPFDPNATLLALAKQNGWNSGVDGWYIPYCRILNSVPNSCSWESSILATGLYGTSEENSVLVNAAFLPNMFLGKLGNRETTASSAHMQEYRNVMARTSVLIDNDQVQFVYLHLPVPHPPGIYDRVRHRLRAGGTYLDNLVLADDTLGILLRQIDASPSANVTTLIVSSDHSWRVPLWKPAQDWTPEEERASGGRFDDRPVLLIHFSGQTSNREVDAMTPELLEHDMVAGMLTGKIKTPENLAGFLAQQGR